jgi:PBP1b-binding outer membrane lipoprotein LpoB
MKNISALSLILAIFLFGCASQKETVRNLQLGTFNITPCQNETQLNDPNEFLGETVDNLSSYQQSSFLAVSFKVRTRCNAQLAADVEKQGTNIILKLKNIQGQIVQCACYMNFATTITNLEPGTYRVMVMNAAGNILLADQSGVVFK